MFPVGYYFCVPSLRAAAKVKTTQRLNSTVLTRNLNRYEDVGEFQGDSFSILRYLKDDIPALILAVLLAAGVAYYNTLIPLALGNLTTALNSLNSYSHGTFLGTIRHPALQLLKYYCFHALGTALYITVLSGIGERFACRIRLALFRSLVFRDMSFYDTHKVGELINRLTGDVQEVKSSLKQIISLGIRNTVQFTGSCISLYSISPCLTAVLFCSAFLLTSLGSLMGSLLRAASRHAQDQVAASTSLAEEVLGNLVTVKSFAMEEEEVAKYEGSLDTAATAYSGLGIGIGLFTAASALATNGMVLQTLFYGGYLLSTGQVGAGDLMAFLASSTIVQRSLQNMSLLISQVVKGTTAAARVSQYLDEDISRAPGEVLLSPAGEISFKGVSFSYPSRPEMSVLDEFNLDIKPGQTVALCGASGAGKSTVGALLERFYEPKEGTILLDGRDIGELDTKWLRGSCLGYIGQEPVLFATTIKENIKYGAPSASETEIERAARAANAHDFISEFPEGYDTLVGERGTTLSGGQKQRIAIARALLKNPAVLILDEATSALDASSERVVSEALQRLCSERTVIVIAHRLSTVRNSDCIVVLNKGKIVEKGTHDELIIKEGTYFNLVKNQTDLNQDI
ncbi:mitochondrial potassium channel ATP-binding subunit-like [Bolinopsis microptera]|uniref:mitochondrial potassium channel ATP-binding subunit-like n=1 Tax=Bolinopsis microptera TaxID=2820187 RepID=UPI003078AD49